MTAVCQEALFELGTSEPFGWRARVVATPQTQGIKYAGAKTKLIAPILDHLDLPSDARVFDAFSGTSRVSQALARCGYQVISSDIAHWAECFSIAFLEGTDSSTNLDDLLRHLASLKPQVGWFTERYGGIDKGDRLAIAEDGTRRVWQAKNAMRIDAIRDEIDRLHMSRVDQSVALTALILAADRVDSTVGHYASFLREWSPRSYGDLNLTMPDLVGSPERRHTVVRGDIRDVLRQMAGGYDAIYLDPPYGSNNDKMPSSRVRYSAYYNIWTSLVLNDHPETYGRSNRRVDTSDRFVQNEFEDFRRHDGTGHFIAYHALAEVLSLVTCDVMVFSYSSEGRIPLPDLMDLLTGWGRVEKATRIDSRRHVMSSMRWTHDWLKDETQGLGEYLFRVVR